MGSLVLFVPVSFSLKCRGLLTVSSRLGLRAYDPILRRIRGRLLPSPRSSPCRGSFGDAAEADVRLALEVQRTPPEGITVSHRGK